MHNTACLLCYACGGMGHMARDCAWDKKKLGNPGKGGFSKGKGKGKGYGKGYGGKGSKGYGKGKGGKGGKDIVCYNCGKTGHKADTCYSPKKVQAVEEQTTEANAVSIGGIWHMCVVERW